MDSLRSRPSQAPRKGQKSPTKLSKGAPTRNKTTRVDDKIKKRMSMRYADISSPIDSAGIPSIPGIMGAIPGGLGGELPLRGGEEDLRDRTRVRDDAKVAADDKKLLSAEDFNPDEFLKSKLANSTEAELKSLQSALRNAKDDTATELQHSVFKNYAEFVLISKEISVLENEMLELKDLLSDYKSMPSMLHIPDPTSTSSSTLSTYKRSSVADLRILYFNQMQALHSSIEGAAKFVPTTPGRHVVGEFENVMSLNAATYKIIYKVKFVVLDDAVLVAKRRRRNAGGGPDGGGSTVNEGKLVAERCWQLNEMLVLDTKDSPNMTNVFKIRHGKETHVYRTESVQDKKGLLAMFRQVAEELSSKRRKEREGEHERRKSMWQAGPPDRNSSIPPMPEWMADLARKGGDIPGADSDAKDKIERDTRWTGDWSDKLTVAIALKEWAKAVELVEEGQNKLPTVPLLAPKLPGLTNQLTTSLLESLALPSNRKTAVVSLISLLNRLKAGSAARSTFLEMRSKVIHGHMRKIRFEGHVGIYIGELAVVYFTGIKHTADWYLASFKENEVASSFITWAKQEVEKYAEIFRTQVYSRDVDPKVVEEARHITHSQSRKLLEEYGLDFRYLLDSLLLQTPKELPKTQSTFHLNEQRQSKQILQSSKLSAKQPDLRSQRSQSQLKPAPPPLNIPATLISRHRSPVPRDNGALPPPVNTGSLYPPPSAALKSGIISAASSYLNAHQAENTNDTAGQPLRTPHTSNMYRSRTPISSTQQQNGSTTPASAPIPTSSSPPPRRQDSPPLSATPFRPGNSYGHRDRVERPERERPPRSLRGSPVPRTGSPASLPPKSINRPGSGMGYRPLPVAVPQREGMI